MRSNGRTKKPRSALAGLRVLELGDEKAWYCGKLLADLGADVVKVEAPCGDAESRQLEAAFVYSNVNKRSVTLDLDSRSGRAALRRLAGGADLILDAGPIGRLDACGLGFETLRRRKPALVWVALSGFGLTGPWAGYRGTDLVISALGGAMFVTGAPEDPPVVLAGEQAWKTASAVAAAGALIALREARRSGRGQLVDVSALEATAAVTHICGAAKFLEDGIVPRRNGTALFASVPSGAYRCADGRSVYLMVNRPAHWRELARWVNEVTDNVEILDTMFEGPSSARQPYRELLDLYIGDLFSRMSADHAYREGQRRHLAVTPVNGALEVAKDPQLRSRRFFVRTPGAAGRGLRVPGAPYRLGRTPWRLERAAPARGEHSRALLGTAALPARRAAARVATRRGPRSAALAGLRVLELTAGMAGPWIGRFMAYCGADVVKIESRAFPDVTRLYVSPRAPEKGVQEAASPWFTDWNAGKRFVAMDLTRLPAVDLCKRLVAESDVVVCNYSVGVLDKLGLGYKALARVKPDLVMLLSTGYGATGPNRGFVTWGPNIEALSGMSALSGFAHRECTVTQFAYPDAVGALHGLVAVMAALAHRDRTGEGQRIDLSQYEATVATLGEVFAHALASKREPARRGNASASVAPHGCYPCAGEDRWCAIAVTSDAEWLALCEVMGREDLASDEGLSAAAGRVARCEELDRVVSAWTSGRDAYVVMEALQGVGVPAGVVQTIEDQLECDAQLAARGFFEKIPRRSCGAVTANGIPLRLVDTPGQSGSTGAAIGADNVAVLREVLGLGDSEIAELAALGVLQMPGEDPGEA